MALIYCRECGKQISDKAAVCPHCGYSYAPQPAQQMINTDAPMFNTGAENNVQKTKNIKKKTFRMTVDTIVHSILSVLFIVLIYTETIFRYTLVSTSDYEDFDKYVLSGNFNKLLTFGADDAYIILQVFVIAIVVLMVVFNLIKSVNEKTRASSAFGIINLILSVVLGVSFPLISFLSSEDFTTISYSLGAGVGFTNFSSGFYIALILLVAFVGCAIASICVAKSNKKKLKMAAVELQMINTLEVPVQAVAQEQETAAESIPAVTEMNGCKQ